MRDVNLMTLMDDFNCDTKCRDTLGEAVRWPSGVACLRCGDTDVTEIASRNQFRCTGCRYRFSVTAGTIMHRSHLPLRKWFVAICLMCQSKKGVSANQLKRMLGVQYKTAWHLCHRIRGAMGNDPFTGPTLVGIVELDETMIGGKAKGENWRDNKQWVAGAVERGGRIRLERIADIKKRTIHDFVERTVSDRAEAIYTDELASHMGVETDTRRHESVNHSAEEWVVGCPHQQRGRRLEPLQAVHRRQLPQDERQAHGPVLGGTGVAVQQPEQPLHLPGRAPAHRPHRPA